MFDRCKKTYSNLFFLVRERTNIELYEKKTLFVNYYTIIILILLCLVIAHLGLHRELVFNQMY